MRKILIAVMLTTAFFYSSCDLINPAAVDEIKSKSNRTNPADSGFWEKRMNIPSRKSTIEQKAISVEDSIFFMIAEEEPSGAIINCYIYDTLADSWKTTAVFPGKNHYSVLTAAIGRDVFLIGGNTDLTSSVYLKEGWRYNNQTDEWSRIADLPEGDFLSAPPGVCTSGDRIYITAPDLQYVYDSVQDIWETETYSGAGSVKPVGTTLHVHSNSAENKKIYSIDDNGLLYLYDPAAKTSTVGPKIPVDIPVFANAEYFVIGSRFLIRRADSDFEVYSIPLDISGDNAVAELLPDPPAELKSGGYRTSGCVSKDSVFFLTKGKGLLYIDQLWIEGNLYRYKL